MTELSELDIAFFLHLGYFPNYVQKCILPAPEWGDPKCSDHHGINILRASVLDRIKPGQTHCVPLSGGLDSRAILSILREGVEASNIHTYTFGTPKTYDYEIGAVIANRAGTRHRQMDLTQTKWSIDSLIKTAKSQDAQTMLFHHIPYEWLHEYKDHIIWSGYVGDAIMGGHRDQSPSANISVAKERYLYKRAESKSIALHNNQISGMMGYIGNHMPDHKNLTADEKLLLSEVGAITAPHIMPSGFAYETPFINSKVLGWAFALSSEDRLDRKAFKSMMRTYAPDLFDMPDKENWGLSHNVPAFAKLSRRIRNKILHMVQSYWPAIGWPPSPNMNFADYNMLIREKADLYTLIHETLQALEDRQIIDWINPLEYLDRHMKRQINCADALCILTSLEINLRAKEART